MEQSNVWYDLLCLIGVGMIMALAFIWPKDWRDDLVDTVERKPHNDGEPINDL